jgi:hypothetical protein
VQACLKSDPEMRLTAGQLYQNMLAVSPATLACERLQGGLAVREGGHSGETCMQDIMIQPMLPTDFEQPSQQAVDPVSARNTAYLLCARRCLLILIGATVVIVSLLSLAQELL